MSLAWTGGSDGVHPALSVTGELDLHTAPAFSRAVREALNDARPTLVVDLSALTFMDCSGVTALIITRREALSRGCRIELVGTTARVQKLLHLTGVEGLFASEIVGLPEPRPETIVLPQGETIVLPGEQPALDLT